VLDIQNVYENGPAVVNFENRLDDRGAFSRVFCVNEFAEESIDFLPRQANVSLSKIKGTIRGLHFQFAPKSESKYIRVLAGSIFDVCVDLNPGENFMRVSTFIISDSDSFGVLIPKGFAHGFQTLMDRTTVEYLVDEFYSQDLESGVLWNDPTLQIDWPTEVSEISERDRRHPLLDSNRIKELGQRFR
jgi:dTDP-4-dehydrorhamnose 3,5-epimerase